jgi:hypothetical protein
MQPAGLKVPEDDLDGFRGDRRFNRDARVNRYFGDSDRFSSERRLLDYLSHYFIA